MSERVLSDVLRRIRQMVRPQGVSEQTDGYLLDRFIHDRDEAAFDELLGRHGPMVLGVCRHLLGNVPDAEDVFQATFMVLLRKAGSIQKRGSLASWLHGVAYRLACNVKIQSSRRRRYERQAPMASTENSPESSWEALTPALHEEINRLPEHYRTPVILCYVEGKSNDQASLQMGVPVGTVKSRLARAREILRQRLEKRHVTLAMAVLVERMSAGGLTAGVPPALRQTTLEAATLLHAGQNLAISTAVLALTERMVRIMVFDKVRVGLVAVVALACIGAGSGLLYRHALAGSAAPPKKAVEHNEVASSEPDRPNDVKPAQAPEAKPEVKKETTDDDEARYKGLTVAHWIKKLQSGNEKEHAESLIAITVLGPPAAAAVPDLIHWLDNDTFDNRITCLLALGRVGGKSPEALKAIVRATKDASGTYRWFAYQALGALGSGAAPALPYLFHRYLEPYKELTSNESEELANIEKRLGMVPTPGGTYNAYQGILAVGPVGSQPIAGLDNPMEPPELNEILHAVKHIGCMTPELAAAIRESAKSKKGDPAAIGGFLFRFGPKSLPLAIELCGYDANLCSILSTYPLDGDTWSAFRANLTNPNPNIRLAVATSLLGSANGSPDDKDLVAVVPQLQKMAAEDADQSVRKGLKQVFEWYDKQKKEKKEQQKAKGIFE